MRTTVLAGSLPNPTSGGGALTVYTIIEHLLDRGDDLTVCALVGRAQMDHTGKTRDDRVADLRARGAEVVLVESQATVPAGRTIGERVRRTLKPPLAQLYPTVADAPRVAEAVAGTSPNVVFVYHWEALAASRLVRAPRVAAVGDPSHLPFWYRWRDDWPSVRALRTVPQLQAAMRAQPAAMARLLNECSAAGAFAAHHAQWLRDHGVPDCKYFRTPVPAAYGGGPPPERSPGVVPRILLLGHLAGIVTIDGLRVFARMLPLLERAFGRHGFEVRVVGGLEPPADLLPQIQHPSVRFVGHTEEPENEIQAADVFLVPNSIPLGIRVRIITGFACGAPIVSHYANAAGIPELADGVNALLGRTPEELVAAVVQLCGDPELRARIGRTARATYERSFSPIVAAAAIAEEIDRVASRSTVEAT